SAALVSGADGPGKPGLLRPALRPPCPGGEPTGGGGARTRGFDAGGPAARGGAFPRHRPAPRGGPSDAPRSTAVAVGRALYRPGRRRCRLVGRIVEPAPGSGRGRRGGPPRRAACGATGGPVAPACARP